MYYRRLQYWTVEFDRKKEESESEENESENDEENEENDEENEESERAMDHHQATSIETVENYNAVAIEADSNAQTVDNRMETDDNDQVVENSGNRTISRLETVLNGTS